MNKKNYFRKSPVDFHKWCRLTRHSQTVVREFRRYPVYIRYGMIIEYAESRLIANQYEVLRSMLTDIEIELLEKYLMTNKVSPGDLFTYNKYIRSCIS